MQTDIDVNQAYDCLRTKNGPNWRAEHRRPVAAGLQVTTEVHLDDLSLVTDRWPFFREAQLAGANYSPGVRGVWMGRPHRVTEI